MTGPYRRRGHAFHADQARKALGLADIHDLTDLPQWLVHGTLGVAALALAFVARAGDLGLANSLLAAVVVGVLLVLALWGVDHLLYPRHQGSGWDTRLMPVASLWSFCAVMAMSPQLWLRLIYAAITVAVMAVVPGLPASSQPRARSHFHWSKWLREGAGVIVLLPALLLGITSKSLPAAGDVLLIFAATFMVTLDETLSEIPARRRAFLISFAVAALVGALGAVLLWRTLAIDAAVTASLTLVFWYGVAGMMRGVFRHETVAAMMEYCGFAAVAVIGIALLWPR